MHGVWLPSLIYKPILFMKYLKMLLMVPQNLPCNDASVGEKITCDPRNTFLTYSETGRGSHRLGRGGPRRTEGRREWSQGEELGSPHRHVRELRQGLQAAVGR